MHRTRSVDRHKQNLLQLKEQQMINRERIKEVVSQQQKDLLQRNALRQKLNVANVRGRALDCIQPSGTWEDTKIQVFVNECDPSRRSVFTYSERDVFAAQQQGNVRPQVSRSSSTPHLTQGRGGHVSSFERNQDERYHAVPGTSKNELPSGTSLSPAHRFRTRTEMDSAHSDVTILPPTSVGTPPPVSGRPRSASQQHKLGVVPDYLHKRKAEITAIKDELRRANEEAAERAKYPPGQRPITQDEQESILEMLREKKVELETRLNRIPLRFDNPSLQRRKKDIESELAETEEDIRKFSRKNVLVPL